MAATRERSQKAGAVFRWGRLVNIFTATFVSRSCAVVSVIGFLVWLELEHMLHIGDESDFDDQD